MTYTDVGLLGTRSLDTMNTIHNVPAFVGVTPAGRCAARFMNRSD